MDKKKFSFVNIVFYVIFGVVTGVLWAYASPIPLIPGAVHFRIFAFFVPAAGFLFGPWAGFFTGYIGTMVWSLLGGYFIPLHSPLADGITVGLSGFFPAWVMLRGGKTLEDITANKLPFIWKSLVWSVLFGILMIFSTSLSLSYFTDLDYWFCVIWIGIADVVPIALCPFVVVWLAPKIKKLHTIMPYR